MPLKIYLEQNVYEAAIERINWLFDEFKNVIVNISGGKDSTVVYHIALQIAEERGRLPLQVMFIDQEAEWAHTINLVRKIMDDPRVKPMWFQMPIRIFNAASHSSDWLHCWAPGEKWMREKEPDSIKENVYGVDRFNELFGAIIDYHYPNEPACYIAGVRAAENPKRAIGLTRSICYKDVTWGKIANKKKKHIAFYPIYDWNTSDVWKAINDNKWEYNKIYDYMYSYGVPIQKMRVSNLHHETALEELKICQEIEPDTWNALLKRIDGANSIKQLKDGATGTPKELPFMFTSWREYRDYLLDNLVVMEDARTRFRKRFEIMDKTYEGMHNIDDMYKNQIMSILANDYFMTKIDNFERRPDIYAYIKYKRTGFITGKAIKDGNAYIFGDKNDKESRRAYN